MKPVNIYALTRINDGNSLSRLERQLSGRDSLLKIKTWETDGLRLFCEELSKVMDNAFETEFYYSFVMPKLGKEFDLIRINDEYIINVELKSGNVSDEAIIRQLKQNRYYLATTGLPVFYFTFISSMGRLVRLSNTGRLVDTDFTELAGLIDRQEDCFEGDIEELFSEDKYIISPLSDPDRFLRGDYFLTFQQRDIKHQLVKNLSYKDKDGNLTVRGFTGYPGTGKTLLLYDTAMFLSQKERVCLLHLGPKTMELDRLNSILKRIDFYYWGADLEKIKQEKYTTIFVDEGHKLTQHLLNEIVSLADVLKAPIIVSYNREDAVCPEERGGSGTGLIESMPGFTGFKLTNRIRLNNELSAFIRCIVHASEPYHKHDFPSVSLSYASNEDETDKLIKYYIDCGYTYIKETEEGDIGLVVGEAVSKEFAGVVMILNENFYYDEQRYLRAKNISNPEDMAGSRVRDLFHGLSRAKKNIAIVVKNNGPVFEEILSILQK